MAIIQYRTEVKDDVISEMIEWPKVYFHTRLQRTTSLVLCMILFIHLTLIGSIQLLTNTNATYWMNHSLTTFGSFSMIVSYATLLGQKQNYLDVAATYFPKLWPLSQNPSSYAIFKNQGRMVRLYFLSVMICLTVIALTIIPLNEYNYHHLAFAKQTIDRFGHKWGYLAGIPMNISMFHGLYAIEACGAALTYMIFHLKFQLSLLNDKLSKMQNTIRQEDLMEDHNYQSGVRRELVACIDHYCLLKQLEKRINANIFYPIFGFVFCGIVVALGIIASLKYSAITKGEISLTPLFVTCAFGMFLGSFFTIGQFLVDESEKLFCTIANLPWYLWNKENRKIVVIVLVATQKPLLLSSAGIVNLNHKLLISFFRMIYSTAMFLVKF